MSLTDDRGSPGVYWLANVTHLGSREVCWPANVTSMTLLWEVLLKVISIILLYTFRTVFYIECLPWNADKVDLI